MENFGESSATEYRFGRRVRTEREKRGWTQADLASRLSEFGLALHPSAIAKIELRDVDRPRAIRLDEAEVIARVFGLTVDEMYESPEHRIQSLETKIGFFVGDFDRLVSDGAKILEEVSALLELSTEADRASLSARLSVPELGELLKTSAQLVDAVVFDAADRARQGLPSNESLMRMLPPSRFAAYRARQDQAVREDLANGTEA